MYKILDHPELVQQFTVIVFETIFMFLFVTNCYHTAIIDKDHNLLNMDYGHNACSIIVILIHELVCFCFFHETDYFRNQSLPITHFHLLVEKFSLTTYQ
jgi:hypothetical protein